MIWNETIECMDREKSSQDSKHTTQENCGLRLSQHAFLPEENAGNGYHPR